MLPNASAGCSFGGPRRTIICKGILAMLAGNSLLQVLVASGALYMGWASVASPAKWRGPLLRQGRQLKREVERRTAAEETAASSLPGLLLYQKGVVEGMEGQQASAGLHPRQGIKRCYPFLELSTHPETHG